LNQVGFLPYLQSTITTHKLLLKVICDEVKYTCKCKTHQPTSFPINSAFNILDPSWFISFSVRILTGGVVCCWDDLWPSSLLLSLESVK